MRTGHKYKQALIILSITLTAAALRLYNLHDLPGGLWFDEAQNALDAITVYEKLKPRVFFSGSSGREGLLINLAGLAYMATGVEPYLVRFITAFAGILCIPLIFFLGKRYGGIMTGAAAAFLLACSKWHITFSRIGFRSMLLVLLQIFVILAAVSWLHKNNRFWLILAGISAGAALYTYIPSRLFWIMPLMIILFLSRQYGIPIKKALKGAAVYIMFFVLMAMPLSLYFLQNPEDFAARIKTAGYMLDGRSFLTEFVKATGATFWMLIGKGDGNPMFGIPGEPAFSLLTSLFILIGLAMTLRHPLRKFNFIILLWILFTFPPGALGRPAPHALRSLGMVSPFVLIAAAGWKVALSAARISFSRRWIRRLIPVAATSLFLLGALNDVRKYFVVYPQSVNMEELFSSRETRMIERLSAAGGPVYLYLSPQLYFHPTVQALCYGKHIPLLFTGEPVEKEWWMRRNPVAFVFVEQNRHLFWCRFVLEHSRNWAAWWHENGYIEKEKIVPSIYKAYGASNPVSGDDGKLIRQFKELYPALPFIKQDIFLWLMAGPDSVFSETAFKSKPEKTFGVSDFLHETGNMAVLHDAIVADEANKDKNGFLAYGPYVRLPIGRYKACFHIQADFEPQGNSIASVQVSAMNGRRILAEKSVEASKPPELDKFSQYELTFDNEYPFRLEFRVKYHGKGRIAFRKVTVKPV